MNFENFLIVTDLDGTLFNRNQAVPERSINAIEYFKKNGGNFTFATGRNRKFIDRRFAFLKDLINAPAITSNGAYVHDFFSGEVYYNLSFDYDFSHNLLREITKKFPDMPIEIDTRDSFYVLNPTDHFYERYTNMTDLVTFANTPIVPEEDIVRILYIDYDTDRIKAAADFTYEYVKNNPIELVFSESFIFEILPKGATKGNGVNQLRKIFNRDLTVISAGDWNNDMSQLVAADIAICPSNANDDVKRICKHILCDCDEGIIADIVENIENGTF